LIRYHHCIRRKQVRLVRQHHCITRQLCGLALLFFCLIGGQTARADFAAGIEAYTQGDYRTALDEWLPYAAENDSRALFNLGQMYRLGQGVDKDMAIAEQYYRRAARQGHPAARGNLGSIYYTRTPPQIDEALYYWRAAARDGDVRSQYLLGVQYFNGEHVAKDHVLAYAWISLAAAAGLQEAKDALQVLAKYLNEKDINEGKRLSHTFDIPNAESTTPEPEQAASKPEPVPEPKRQVVEAESGVAVGSDDIAADTATREGARQNTRQPVVEVAAAEVLEEDRPVITTQSSENQAPEPTTQQVIAEPVTVSAVDVGYEQPAEPEVTTPKVHQMPASEPEPAKSISAEPEEQVAEEMSLAADLYRVQIAALRSEELAADYWQRASTRRPVLMAGIVHYIQQADLGAKGIYYRVQLGNFENRASASGFCDQLKETELSCYVVKTP